MNIVEFSYGYIVTEDEEISEYIHQCIQDDTLWDYISILVNNDLKGGNKPNPQPKPEESSRLDSIESMLQSLLKANPNGMVVSNSSNTEPPKPVESSEPPKPVEPKKVKKAPVKGKGNKGFAAAAARASSFR